MVFLHRFFFSLFVHLDSSSCFNWFCLCCRRFNMRIGWNSLINQSLVAYAQTIKNLNANPDRT